MKRHAAMQLLSAGKEGLLRCIIFITNLNHKCSTPTLWLLRGMFI